jgi:hypothetical protein
MADNDWDRLVKMLIRRRPQDFLDIFLPGASFLRFLPVEMNEVRKEKLEVDILIIVEYQGKEALVHIEAKTFNDRKMDRRLLRYTIQIEEQQKQVPTSCVMYLLRDGNVPTSPLQWLSSSKLRVYFDFESFEVGRQKRQDLLNLNKIGWWPLLSMTVDETVRDLVEQLCERLHALGEFDLEYLTVYLAELPFQRYGKGNCDWLVRRKVHMQETIPESTFVRELVEKGLLEGLEKGRKEGREEELASLREVLLDLVDSRFASLSAQANKQAKQMHTPEGLKEAIRKVGRATTLEEAQQAILQISVAQDSEQAAHALVKPRKRGDSPS